MNTIEIESLKQVYQYLNNNKIYYGKTKAYNSLLPCEHTLITENTVTNIELDLLIINNYYREWNSIYNESCKSNSDISWVQNFIELGLLEQQIEANRLIANSSLEPKIARIDYIKIHGERKISEIQWKSGGFGLFAGIQNAFLEQVPLPYQQRSSVINLSNEIIKMIEYANHTNNHVLVGCFRKPWLNGEKYLSNIFQNSGIKYLPLTYKDFSEYVRFDKGKLFFAKGNMWVPISIAYGLGFWSLFQERIMELVKNCLNGNIWIETPLNVLYRQKWGMALPFMRCFNSNNFNKIRNIFPATALIRVNTFDIFPMIEIDSPLMFLSEINNIDQITKLPRKIRENFIIKCGGGINLNSRSLGVIRLSGTKNQVQKKIEFVKYRITKFGEPWIIQEYIKTSKQLLVINPLDFDTPINVNNMHSRFLVFADFFRGNKYIGGIANYAKHWKVSGTSNLENILYSSVFSDIRITK